MRNMSFSITTAQVKARTKTVTRRLGWWFLKPGDLLCAIEKGQGLKKGETVKRMGFIRVLNVRGEPLCAMTDDLSYGFAETDREGFPEGDPKHWPSEFVGMFCSHNRCSPEMEVNRIEFEYVGE